MHYVTTRVGKVAIQVSGEGPPLLLLHSVAHDHHDYDDVLPSLSKDFQTFAVDWPGHGDSEMWSPPESATTALMCDALEDVVEALSLPRAIIMGSSVGGTAAVRLAARKPDRVRALVLVDSGGSAETSALVRGACWVQGRELVRSWTGMQFARWYLKTPGPGTDSVLRRLEDQRKRAGFIEMDAAMWRSFGTVENDLATEARQVTAPTLIVWGKYDPVIRPGVEGRRLRALLPHAQYVELSTGHVPFVEKPTDFLAAVRPFLVANRAPARGRHDDADSAATP